MCLRSFLETINLHTRTKEITPQTFAVPRAKNSRTTLLPSLVCTISTIKSLQLRASEQYRKMKVWDILPLKYLVIHLLPFTIVCSLCYFRQVLPERPMDDCVSERALVRVIEPATEGNR